MLGSHARSGSSRAAALALVLTGGCVGSDFSPTAPKATSPSGPTIQTPAPTSGQGQGSPSSPRPTPTPSSGGGFSDVAPCELAGRSVSTPELVAPTEDLEVRQDDRGIGCTPSPTHGHGFRIDFDWLDSCGVDVIDRYQLFVMHPGASSAALDVQVDRSEYRWDACGRYVIERNRRDWRWRVRARDRSGNWSDWSEARAFDFGRCPAVVVTCG